MLASETEAATPSIRSVPSGGGASLPRQGLSLPRVRQSSRSQGQEDVRTAPTRRIRSLTEVACEVWTRGRAFARRD